jgi:23S rRNA (pseudouridine1915-N3)-methyltransferase
MKIRLIVIGKTKQAFVNDGCAVYRKRIGNYVPFEEFVIPSLKNTKNLSPSDFRRREGDLIQKQISQHDFTVFLDESGKTYDSESFAGYIQQCGLSSVKTLNFIIGGEYGFSSEVYKLANDKISLSKMTFSHQLVRVIFMEQLYRAFTIIHNEPYHNP